MKEGYQYQKGAAHSTELEAAEAVATRQVAHPLNGVGSEVRTVDVIVYLGIYKIIFFFFVFCSIELLPIFNEPGFAGHKSYPLEGEPTLASHFGTWDSAHYLYLAQHGYEAGDPSCAFYPLLPLLINLGSYLTLGHPVIAGLFITNIASFIGLVWFYRLVATYHGCEISGTALILMLAFPGAFFFNLIYTEGIFLMLIVGFFWFLFRQEYAKSATISFFLPLTKAVGVFAILPLLWQLFTRRAPWRSYLALAGPLGGYAAYFVAMALMTGDPLEGFDAQRYYPNQPSIANMFDVTGMLTALLQPLEFHGATNSIIDRVVFTIFVVSLILTYWVSKPYFLYAACAGLIPALSVWWMSYTRNIMAAFPIFIALAGLLYRERLLVRAAIVGVLTSIQALLVLRHINFLWAG